ncbi:predicted protein [Botrytis cinerea T4]|uniref:Uncharacterized protein n=1 Tax=Botryotinia fuckeliana (strain T4) TaxID=999810 RepID=G2Y4H6_BOTF4|nr:predicted protein [Botrytis cinerea T4]
MESLGMGMGMGMESWRVGELESWRVEKGVDVYGMVWKGKGEVKERMNERE